MEHTKTPDLKNNAFDFVRLLFAFFVVYAHSRYLYGAPDIFHWEDSHFSNLHAGSIGVWGFFAISGFLVATSFLKSNSIADFLTKRFKRIFPGFWCSLLVCALLFAPLWYFIKIGTLTNFIDINGLYIWKFLVTNMDATIQTQSIGSLVSDSINGPYWTIRHEINCYVILAIFLSLTKFSHAVQRYGLLYLTCLLSCIRLLFNYNANFAFAYPQWFGDEKFLLFLVIFLWGATLSLYKEHIKPNWMSAFLAFGLLIIATEADFLPFVFPLCFSYLIICLCFILPIRNIGERFGDFSYGIYLYHWPVRLTLQILGFQQKLGLWPFIALNVVCTLPLAYMSWTYVERRFLRHKHKLEKTPLVAQNET